MRNFILNSWVVINRLKIHFLMIFFLMNYSLMREYTDSTQLCLIVLTYTILNFSLHMFNNYFDFTEDTITNQTLKKEERKMTFYLAIFSFLISLLLVIYFKFSLICFLLIFILGISYSIPLKNNFRIKKVIFIKNLTGSLFWWYIPFIAMIYFNTDTEQSFFTLFMSRLITLAIFIPFEPLWDIKDMNGDQDAGIVTIPIKYGLIATKFLIISMFTTLSIVCLGFYNYPIVLFLFIPLILFTLSIKNNTPIYQFQIMMFYLPFYILFADIL